jgi:hypothetical protein
LRPQPQQPALAQGVVAQPLFAEGERCLPLKRLDVPVLLAQLLWVPRHRRRLLRLSAALRMVVASGRGTTSSALLVL